MERRSLRWAGRRPRSHGPRAHNHGPRTSLDLELDLRAQQTRQQALQDELQRLRDLKARLEVAREKGDQELAAWVLEDQQFQNLIAQVLDFIVSIICVNCKSDCIDKNTMNKIYFI